MARRIVTEFIYPPIPDRSMDWRASFEDGDEYGPFGYGPTEEAARQDLLENEEFKRELPKRSYAETHWPYEGDGGPEAYRRDLKAAGRGHLLKD